MMTDVAQETPQQRFDRVYISSMEIIESLSISRSAISQARKRGLLPEPITSHNGSMLLWERDKVQPALDAWGIMLKVRRHNA
jgi:hypothetical protein